MYYPVHDLRWAYFNAGMYIKVLELIYKGGLYLDGKESSLFEWGLRTIGHFRLNKIHTFTANTPDWQGWKPIRPPN